MFHKKLREESYDNSNNEVSYIQYSTVILVLCIVGHGRTKMCSKSCLSRVSNHKQRMPTVEEFFKRLRDVNENYGLSFNLCRP